MISNKVDGIIMNALIEDTHGMDITTESIFDVTHHSEAILISKEDGILSGIDVFERTLQLTDAHIEMECLYKNGDSIQSGTRIASVKGPTRSILMAERTALNLLQRMSGIATMTNRFVKAASATGKAKIVDTRKTVPGLRILDKMAVKHGGGYNHRMGLYDAILIKDNHIDACGGVQQAIMKCRGNASHVTKIEVEVRNLDELREAIEAGADIVLLDNMNTDQMREAVDISNGRVLLEASGNMTLDRIPEVAKTGVDLISVGALTHSVSALDISLVIK